MTPIEQLKNVGDQPFTIQGYQRSDGSVVNLNLRMLPPDGYKRLLQESLDRIERERELIDSAFSPEAREAVTVSLKKSLTPAELVEKPKRVSHEQITSVSENLALLDDDPDKVILFRTEILGTETLVPPTKVTKPRDQLSFDKQSLMSGLPVGRFCFRLNLYAGKYQGITT